MSSTIRNRYRCTEYFSSSRIYSDRPHEERWFEDAHVDECSPSAKDFDISFFTVLKNALESFPSIAIDPDVICGTPRIAGTRIPVYMVLDAVQYYGTLRVPLSHIPS